MTQDTQTGSKPAAQPQPAVEDLSAAIEQAVDRQPDEEVRSVRVFGDRYRCNWWVREKATQAWFLTTGKIRKSRFLRVTMAADKLVIEDLSNRH
jgi:hypothetical protein